MGSVAEVHFIAMHVCPFDPQTTGQIAAHARGNNLCHGQPNDGGDAQSFGAYALT